MLIIRAKQGWKKPLREESERTKPRVPASRDGDGAGGSTQGPLPGPRHAGAARPRQPPAAGLLCRGDRDQPLQYPLSLRLPVPCRSREPTEGEKTPVSAALLRPQRRTASFRSAARHQPPLGAPLTRGFCRGSASDFRDVHKAAEKGKVILRATAFFSTTNIPSYSNPRAASPAALEAQSSGAAKGFPGGLRDASQREARSRGSEIQAKQGTTQPLSPTRPPPTSPFIPAPIPAVPGAEDARSAGLSPARGAGDQPHSSWLILTYPPPDDCAVPDCRSTTAIALKGSSHRRPPPSHTGVSPAHPPGKAPQRDSGTRRATRTSHRRTPHASGRVSVPEDLRSNLPKRAWRRAASYDGASETLPERFDRCLAGFATSPLFARLYAFLRSNKPFASKYFLYFSPFPCRSPRGTVLISHPSRFNPCSSREKPRRRRQRLAALDSGRADGMRASCWRLRGAMKRSRPSHRPGGCSRGRGPPAFGSSVRQANEPRLLWRGQKLRKEEEEQPPAATRHRAAPQKRSPNAQRGSPLPAAGELSDSHGRKRSLGWGRRNCTELSRGEEHPACAHAPAAREHEPVQRVLLTPPRVAASPCGDRDSPASWCARPRLFWGQGAGQAPRDGVDVPAPPAGAATTSTEETSVWLSREPEPAALPPASTQPRAVKPLQGVQGSRCPKVLPCPASVGGNGFQESHRAFPRSGTHRRRGPRLKRITATTPTEWRKRSLCSQSWGRALLGWETRAGRARGTSGSAAEPRGDAKKAVFLAQSQQSPASPQPSTAHTEARSATRAARQPRLKAAKRQRAVSRAWSDYSDLSFDAADSDSYFDCCVGWGGSRGTSLCRLISLSSLSPFGAATHAAGHRDAAARRPVVPRAPSSLQAPLAATTLSDACRAPVRPRAAHKGTPSANSITALTRGRAPASWAETARAQEPSRRCKGRASRRAVAERASPQHRHFPLPNARPGSKRRSPSRAARSRLHFPCGIRTWPASPPRGGGGGDPVLQAGPTETGSAAPGGTAKPNPLPACQKAAPMHECRRTGNTETLPVFPGTKKKNKNKKIKAKEIFQLSCSPQKLHVPEEGAGLQRHADPSRCRRRGVSRRGVSRLQSQIHLQNSVRSQCSNTRVFKPQTNVINSNQTPGLKTARAQPYEGHDGFQITRRAGQEQLLAQTTPREGPGPPTACEHVVRAQPRPRQPPPRRGGFTAHSSVLGRGAPGQPGSRASALAN